jgi:predicted DsbA family dithiol-disulfide isomerase
VGKTYVCICILLLTRTALRRHREGPDANAVSFTVQYKPYQLYPDASKEGQSKQEWFKKSRYGDTQLKMKTYEAIMTAYGNSAGIKYKFGGTIANTMNAHRVIQHFQEEKGPETADKMINCMVSSLAW